MKLSTYLAIALSLTLPAAPLAGAAKKDVAPGCVTDFPVTQAFEDAYFRTIEKFSRQLGLANDFVPVVLGEAVPDGFGNCHLLAYLGKDGTPAGGSLDPVKNYQAFISIPMKEIGVSQANRSEFIELLRQELAQAKLEGLDYQELASDPGFQEAVSTVTNVGASVDLYGYVVLSALRELGLDSP
jgi:hypothetical protein